MSDPEDESLAPHSSSLILPFPLQNLKPSVKN